MYGRGGTHACWGGPGLSLIDGPGTGLGGGRRQLPGPRALRNAGMAWPSVVSVNQISRLRVDSGEIIMDENPLSPSTGSNNL